jgi:hypothetical protein
MLAPIKDFSAIGMLLYIGFALRGRAYQPEWVGPSGIYNVAQSGKNAAWLVLKD